MANQFLSLSLFLMLLSFFIVLNSMSTFEQETTVPAVLNSLSLAYRGYADYYQNMPAKRGVETRTIFKIKPKKVIAHG